MFSKSLTQEKEANLDIIMDHMRQDATEATLKESLKKALTMLDKIKEGYVLSKFPSSKKNNVTDLWDYVFPFL